MTTDLHCFRQQAARARRWAEATTTPKDRETLERIARDYEDMARAAEHNYRADQQADKKLSRFAAVNRVSTARVLHLCIRAFRKVQAGSGR